MLYLFDNGLAPYTNYATAFLPESGANASGAPYNLTKEEQYVGASTELTQLPRYH